MASAKCEALLAKCKDFNARTGLTIDWQALLTQIEEAGVQALLAFLQGLVTTPVTGHARAVQKVTCSPDCLAGLDSAIEKLACGLAGVVCHRQSMTCPDQ